MIGAQRKYKFFTVFNSKNGHYLRTGILNERLKDTGVDPFMASFPHLIDIGIMGSCEHGKKGLCMKAGVECYQSGFKIKRQNMALEDFRQIVQQCAGKVHQFALGGRGDADQHENFEELLKLCKEHDIVPNYTTSGYGMTEALATISAVYCGAVAVSWYRSHYTLEAIRMLIDKGNKTNIHYVLSKDTIEEAIERIEQDSFPKGINAIVFLLHKPVVLIGKKNMV